MEVSLDAKQTQAILQFGLNMALAMGIASEVVKQPLDVSLQ